MLRAMVPGRWVREKMVMVKNNDMIRMGGKGVEGSRLGAGCGGVWRQGRLE